MSDLRTIRNFLYIDLDLLFSLYSQVFGGVSETIQQIQKVEKGGNKTSSNPLPFLPQYENSELMSQYTAQNRILHHELYNQLEAQLSSVIVSPTDEVDDKWRQQMASSFLVKAVGKAEVEDFERLKDILADFNSLAYGFQRAALVEEIVSEKTAIKQAIAALQVERINANSTKSNRAEIDSKIDALKKFSVEDKFVEINDESLDEEYVQFLVKCVDTFLKGRLDVSVVVGENAAFRGVLNREQLQLSPSFFRWLYGYKSISQWTMVGQVTSFADLIKSEASEDVSHEVPLMRESLRNMYPHLAKVEQGFEAVTKRTEVIVRPLAIYQEIALNLDN